MDALSIWVLVTGIGAALGSVAALGHPLTVLSSFLAAPITTLHPLIAAGWVAGLVQAWVKKPTASEWASSWITGRLPVFCFLEA